VASVPGSLGFSFKLTKTNHRDSCAFLAKLFKQIRFFAGDARKERLELEPSRHVVSKLLSGGDRRSVVNLFGSANCLGQQLCLTTSVHRNEPPSGFFHTVAHRQQAVVLEDGGFALAESLRDALAFRVS
jgi:hypothetical protein